MGDTDERIRYAKQERQVTYGDLDNMQAQLQEQIHALHEQYVAVQEGLMKQNLRLIELEEANETKEEGHSNLMARVMALETQMDTVTEKLNQLESEVDSLTTKLNEREIWDVVKCSSCGACLDKQSKRPVPEPSFGKIMSHTICQDCLARALAELDRIKQTNISILDRIDEGASRKSGGMR